MHEGHPDRRQSTLARAPAVPLELWTDPGSVRRRRVQRIARVVLGGAALTMMIASIIIRLVLPVPDRGADSFARHAMAIERPFLVPKRSTPILVDPALVHPGWCQPATAPICQEI
jgi:hypothetical protein